MEDYAGALSSPALIKLLRITEKCRDALVNMEAQTLQCLLLVATKPRIRQSELVDQLKLAPSSVSRNIAMLSETVRPGMPGLGFLRSYEDPENRRTRIVELTDRGRNFVQEIAAIMSA